MTIYRCKRCNYLYIDEEQGKTFQDIEKDYKCAKCRASKNFLVKKETTK